MIISYQKYLTKISTDSDKQAEVDCFKRFLVRNSTLNEKEFNEPYYKGTKRLSPFFMKNVLQLGTAALQASFWEQFDNINTVFFPEGKPEPKVVEGATGINNALSVLENNPVFADVIDQVRNSVSNMDENTDINSILESPDFNKMVGNIKSGLNSGKYKLSDLTGTISAVIGSVQDELDSETQETLKTVSKTMEAVERGETPDMSKVMEMVGNLKLN